MLCCRGPQWYKELDFKTEYQRTGDCCLVEFFVLINDKMWNEKPDVYLRFECKELGDKTCYGPLEVLKK